MPKQFTSSWHLSSTVLQAHWPDFYQFYQQLRLAPFPIYLRQELLQWLPFADSEVILWAWLVKSDQPQDNQLGLPPVKLGVFGSETVNWDGQPVVQPSGQAPEILRVHSLVVLSYFSASQHFPSQVRLYRGGWPVWDQPSQRPGLSILSASLDWPLDASQRRAIQGPQLENSLVGLDRLGEKFLVWCQARIRSLSKLQKILNPGAYKSAQKILNSITIGDANK